MVTFHCHYSSVLCSRNAKECLHWDGVQGGERRRDGGMNGAGCGWKQWREGVRRGDREVKKSRG